MEEFFSTIKTIETQISTAVGAPKYLQYNVSGTKNTAVPLDAFYGKDSLKDANPNHKQFSNAKHSAFLATLDSCTLGHTEWEPSSELNCGDQQRVCHCRRRCGKWFETRFLWIWSSQTPRNRAMSYVRISTRYQGVSNAKCYS